MPGPTPYDIGTNLSFARNFPTVGSLVNVLTSNAFVLAGVIAFIFIVIGGFSIILGAGSGDPKRTESGQKTLTMAVVGLLVIVFSFWIVRGIGLILGFDPLSFTP